jgi:hypothetical protein
MTPDPTIDRLLGKQSGSLGKQSQGRQEVEDSRGNGS